MSANEMTGGEALARMIEAHGGGPMFGMGGFQLLPFYDAARRLRLAHHLINDERAGVFAADAYAKVSGRVGLVDATLGPGATNLVTGLVDAPDASTGEMPFGGYPVLLYGHRSLGLADDCAPSVTIDDDRGDFSSLQGSDGWVVAATDHEGLGGPGGHPYLVGVSEARNMLDAGLAARQIPGLYTNDSTALVGFKTDQAYGRFEYDVTDSVNFYASASWARQTGGGTWFPSKLNPVGGTATAANSLGSTFFKNNPFLSPAVQAALGNNGQVNGTNVFSLGQYTQDEYTYTRTENENENYNFNVGFTGDLGQFKWDVFYTHGKNVNRGGLLSNLNQQKLLAAADAVVGANGQIQCYAATQAATAAQYAGCVPLNPFGPTALTREMFDWYREVSIDKVENGMDNVGGSIAGDLFKGWAGPFRAALSAEYRRMTYETSSTSPHASCSSPRSSAAPRSRSGASRTRPARPARTRSPVRDRTRSIADAPTTWWTASCRPPRRCAASAPGSATR